MSLPADITPLDLSGKYAYNLSLTDPVMFAKLAALGKIIKSQETARAPTAVTFLHHHKNGVEYFNSLYPDTNDLVSERPLSGKPEAVDDPYFGPIFYEGRRLSIQDLPDGIHRDQDWDAGSQEHGVIHAHYVSDPAKSAIAWTNKATTGIAIVEGQRRFIQVCEATGMKGTDPIKLCIVYDRLEQA